MSSTRKRAGKKQSITALTTNTNSTPINVGGWSNCEVQVTLTAGTGDCVFKFQKALEYNAPSAEWVDLEVGGTIAITETATGVFGYDVTVGAGEQLYIVTTAIGTYTLNANAWPYNS